MDCCEYGLAFIVSWLISQFDESIASDALLAALMPVVALVGGNSGAQSLAIVIRALARNDISEARVVEVIGKQSLIGVINGIFMAIFSFILLSLVGLNSYALSLELVESIALNKFKFAPDNRIECPGIIDDLNTFNEIFARLANFQKDVERLAVGVGYNLRIDINKRIADRAQFIRQVQHALF